MQSDQPLRLKNAPIVEAVLDIDCDMPPSFDAAKLEAAAHDKLRDLYPKVRQVFVQEHTLEAKPGTKPTMQIRRGVQAVQFTHDDEKQIVQLRAQGYSFNRLTPYTTLDDYLPEIERTWRLFVGITKPVQIRAVRLRYINRIPLPFDGGKLDLDHYLKLAPHLPDEERMTFAGFLHQHVVVEKDTNNMATIVLATEQPENDRLPIIFDITATRQARAEVEDWAWIAGTIQSLRAFKNRIFKNTLTNQCLNLFQPL